MLLLRELVLPPLMRSHLRRHLSEEVGHSFVLLALAVLRLAAAAAAAGPAAGARGRGAARERGAAPHRHSAAAGCGR